MSQNFYSSAMQSFIHRLSGYSKSTVRLFPQNQTVAGPYSVITLSLPPGQLIDVSSIAMHCQFTTSGTTADNTQSYSCVLPAKDFESHFSSLSISANGQQLSEIRNYNHIWNTLADFTLGAKEVDRSVLNLGRFNAGQPQGNATTTGVGDSAIPAIDKEIYVLQSGTNASTQPYVMQNTDVSMWNYLGFLNSNELLDVDAIGDLKISLTCAGPEVLIQQNVNNATYQLSNIYVSVDTIILPAEYFASQASYLNGAPGRAIRRKFDNWSTFSGPIVPPNQTPTQQTRFTLNSDSVDLLIGTFRNASPKSTLGHFNENQALTAVSGASTGTVDVFQRNGYGVKTWVFNVNGTQIPQWAVSNSRAYWFAAQAMGGVSHDVLGTVTPFCKTLDRFSQGFWIAPIMLAPSSDPESRLIAGYSCRNTNAVFTFETVGDGTYSALNPASGNIGYAGMAREPLVMAKCSSVLQIEAGRLVSVIY